MDVLLVACNYDNTISKCSSVAQKHSVHVYNEFSYCNSLDIGIMSLYNSQDFAIFYPYSLDYYQVLRCKDNSLSLGTLPQADLASPPAPTPPLPPLSPGKGPGDKAKMDWVHKVTSPELVKLHKTMGL